jgi:hypothetical protein
MTGRLLPAAATTAAAVALTGLLMHGLISHQSHTTQSTTGALTPAPSPGASTTQLRVATAQARRLLACPSHPDAGSAPARTHVTCGRFTVLRAEPGPVMDGAASVLLLGLLHPDPLPDSRSDAEPIPMALRLLLRHRPSGELIAQVIEP